MTLCGIEFKMRQQLIQKFMKNGARSYGTAATFDEANLGLDEQYWLDYFAGSFLGSIKKTANIGIFSRNIQRFKKKVL